MIELLGKSLEELQSIFKTHNIQKFRAKQLIDYIYHRYVFDFDEMTQFPKNLRQWLNDNCVISLPTLITESIAPDEPRYLSLPRHQRHCADLHPAADGP